MYVLMSLLRKLNLYLQPSAWLKPERLKNAVDLLVRRRRETDEWNYRENNYSNSDSSSGKEVKHCSYD
jgi:hypothetical protein